MNTGECCTFTPMLPDQERFATDDQQLLTQAKAAGDSLGGIIELLIQGAPPGLGSHVHGKRTFGLPV